ncbi:MAG: rhaS, partial [Verrucomicrobiaceae bacterium]|nr:rhaS [Verrucomicrobiaceae bacterium]
MPRRPASDCLALDALAASVCGMFDHLDGVQFWVKDRAGRYHWVNRAFLLNYSLEQRDQVVGRTDHDLSPAHLADQYVQDDEHVLAGGSVRDRLELVGRFDHTAAWSQTTKLPARNARGTIIGTIGITRVADAIAVQADLPEAAVGRVLAHIRQHYAIGLANQALARLAGRSVRAFERLFVRHTRLTPQRYIRR